MPADFALPSQPPNERPTWYDYQAKNATNADKFRLVPCAPHIILPRHRVATLAIDFSYSRFVNKYLFLL
jgi:hypothetical protein